MIRQFELVERVKGYDPNVDEDALNRAYVFSMHAHGSQKRASGDPYFSHPVEVAGILSGMKLDSSSIVTGLLHDTVEDTVATLEDIERSFGRDIAFLVDGVTKLSRLELQSDHTKQAENFRKLVLAMSEDIRVLLVKLADRLHNMRTLHYVKDPEKRRRIARETMDIFAPLAERMGIHRMKDELEDLAFAELSPEGRSGIMTRSAFLRAHDKEAVEKIIGELTEELRGHGLRSVSVTGREKAPYSIWLKMQRKNISFEQLSDIMAFRVIVENVEQCYQALGILHSQYPVIPGRFKDYISTPKPNNYRSVHTGIIGPEKQRIEIQIRTSEMHEVAELGVAAHWSYKQGARSHEGKQYRWMRELLDILEHAQNPEEFLENTKLEMFQDQVFCFTPKGDLIALPRGATPVDFAYAVHSQVGDRCVSAKINGRIATLRAPLANGDQVEIITSKTQSPSPTWERFVVTGKARARVRRFIRQQQRTQYVDLGREILNKAFRHERLDLSEKILDPVLKNFNCGTADDLYAAVGEGLVTKGEVLNVTYPDRIEHTQGKIIPLSRAKRLSTDHAVPIRGLIPGMALHYAGCCHPLPGDRIVGIVTTGKGVTIHTADCQTLESFAETPERWIDVAWDREDDKSPHVGRISVLVGNEPGSLGSLTTVIGKHEGNITNLKFTNRSSDFFELLVDIEVKDTKHLANVIAALPRDSGDQFGRTSEGLILMADFVHPKLRLGVNIDHVATIRNARGGKHPDPVRAAIDAVAAGADGITAHLREDRRHITDRDIDRLASSIGRPLNLEMAATEEMVAIALRHRPHATCLVPERRNEVTTEGGLDVIAGGVTLEGRVRRLADAAIRVSLFVDADLHQVDAARRIGAQVVELHTGAYCLAHEAARGHKLIRLQQAARHAHAIGLECHAGHGLDYETVRDVAAIPEMAELNIGHYLVGEAIFTGLQPAIRRMIDVMAAARRPGLPVAG